MTYLGEKVVNEKEYRSAMAAEVEMVGRGSGRDSGGGGGGEDSGGYAAAEERV
ncbi:hypothetical protein TWF173_005675 [Orbilia oligospora]|nr:hypothetical protein TWF173_005675 [Orbilia oligospora]